MGVFLKFLGQIISYILYCTSTTERSSKSPHNTHCFAVKQACYLPPIWSMRSTKQAVSAITRAASKAP